MLILTKAYSKFFLNNVIKGKSMSRFNKKSKPSQAIAGAASAAISTLLLNGGGALVSSDVAAGIISMEGIDSVRTAEIENAYDDVENTVKQTLIDAGVSIESIGDAGLEAATIIAMGAGNLVAFAEAATSTLNPSVEGIDVVRPTSTGIAGSIDHRHEVSLEAFEEKDLRNFIGHSVVFNALAAVQDDFAEAFYPTHVLSPDANGLTMSVERTMVMNEIKRAANGSVTDFKKRSIIDAMVDSTILANEATRIVPVYLADDSNAANFVDTAAVPLSDRIVDGVSVKTGPIRNDARFDLLALSVAPGMVGGSTLDASDALAQKVSLDYMYVRVASASEPTKKSVIRFKLAGLPRTSFLPAKEDDSYGMELSYNTVDLVINDKTLTLGGVVPEGLETLVAASAGIRLSVKVNGDTNLETADTHIYSNGITINTVYELASGESLPLDTGAGKSIVDDITFEVLGYDINAHKTNGNRRTRGLLVDSKVVTESYTIPLGPPITAPSPLSSATDKASDLRALVATSRTTTSNAAVTSLLNYVDSLRTLDIKSIAPGTIPAIEGIGRYAVTPFFEELVLDMETRIKSVKSHERASDVAAVLIDAIRDISYRMIRDSNYDGALANLTMGSNEKPKVLIGTDTILPRHLIVSGDERTLSAEVDHMIVSSPDERMNDTIVLTLTRGDKSGKLDPLSTSRKKHKFKPVTYISTAYQSLQLLKLMVFLKC